jgi:hypothetical protein
MKLSKENRDLSIFYDGKVLMEIEMYIVTFLINEKKHTLDTNTLGSLILTSYAVYNMIRIILANKLSNKFNNHGLNKDFLVKNSCFFFMRQPKFRFSVWLTCDKIGKNFLIKFVQDRVIDPTIKQILIN